MNDFNEKLIRDVKIFQSKNENPDILGEKYYFLQYAFEKLEQKDKEELTCIVDEFETLGCNVDGYYYDVDSQTYYLYIVKYDDNLNDDSILSGIATNAEYSKIVNLLQLITLKKYSKISETSIVYELCESIVQDIGNTEIVVNFITNYQIPSAYKRDSIEKINNLSICFRTYDLNDLMESILKEETINDEICCYSKFGEKIPCLLISKTRDFDIYMFYMKGTWLAQLYKEDSQKLLEPNVRSYLKRTSKVNAGILETVKESPESFVAFNNGITGVATGIDVDYYGHDCYSINKIYNFQIVNGGQTTATLSECMKDKAILELDEVKVPVKLTVVKNASNAPELIRNISVYSNTQTAIKKSDPPSNLPYYIEIKRLSNKCLSHDANDINYVCYFERTNGEYNTEIRRNNSSKKFINTHPKKFKFNKLDLAIAVNSWQQLPHIVNLGREKSFLYFNDIISKQKINFDEDYFKNIYALIIIHRTLNDLAKSMKLTLKSNVISYTMSLISYLSDQKINLLDIWDNKKVSNELKDVMKELLNKVHPIISNPPSQYPEPRMWARKELCWDKVKNINYDMTGVISSKKVDFFPVNEADLFINDENNLYDNSLWKKMLIWADDNDIFNPKQLKMIKFCSLWKKETTKNRKQINYAKDLFLLAVNNGFPYRD